MKFYEVVLDKVNDIEYGIITATLVIKVESSEKALAIVNTTFPIENWITQSIIELD